MAQTSKPESFLAITERRHEPLGFVCGFFRGAQLNYWVAEKEAFAQFEGPNHLEYLLLRPDGFHAYCDHADLKLIFKPQAHDIIKKHSINRLGRWGSSYLLAATDFSRYFRK
jgi:hypothetical protein